MFIYQQINVHIYIQIATKSVDIDDTSMFDSNEPTLARYRSLTAAHRAASTPCDGKMVPPCFSARRWDEVNEVLEGNSSF